MGQARQRGTKAQRISAAQDKQVQQEPINIPCKTCGDILNGFTLLQTGLAGAAWQKECSNCGAITTALVQAEHSTLTRTFKSTLGLSDKITGGEKVSVSFIQKNLDTVETGMVRL